MPSAKWWGKGEGNGDGTVRCYSLFHRALRWRLILLMWNRCRNQKRVNEPEILNPSLEGWNPDGPLDSFFNFLHEGWANRSGKGTAEEKGFIECSDLFAFGHG